MSYRITVDTGGTFTDVVVASESGRQVIGKAPTTPERIFNGMKDALESAAEEALKQGTGARGLRSILEQTLLDVMYELPTLTNVTRCVVDRDAILGTADVVMLKANGDTVPLSALAQKSA